VIGIGPRPPTLALSPTTLLKAAGTRPDPAVSVPSANDTARSAGGSGGIAAAASGGAGGVSRRER